MKPFHLFGVAVALAAILGAGCTTPEPNPMQPPPQFRDGIPLDMNATDIYPAGQPYRVSSDWIIPAGRTVRIHPGTEIMFDGLWWVDVRGQIEAVGTVEDPIRFTTAYVQPKLGQWRGFKLRRNEDGLESRFEHCIFTWGAYYDTDTTKLDPLDSTLIEAHTFRGMLCILNSAPVIERCVVYKNQNNAVSLSGPLCAPRIRYNIFNQNDASAVRADTLVPVATFVGEPGKPDVSYNCVSDNSSLAFIYGWDSTRFGRKQKTNANRDSVDFFYNLDTAPSESPLMVDPLHGDFSLQSCSKCVDAGPAGMDLDDFDGTRADMGSVPYVQVAGELRGLLEEDTLSAGQTYRMSCHCKVDSGRTLYVEPGARVEATGVYTLTVAGRLVMDGSAGARIQVAPAAGYDLWGGIEITAFDPVASPSVIRYVDFADYLRFDIEKAGTQIEHCGFSGGFRYGLDVRTHSTEPADTVSVHSCAFTSCGQWAVRLDSSAGAIRNCLIERMAGRGITLHYVGEAAFITNCLIHSGGSSGIYMENLSHPVVVNNTIAGNGYFGLQLTNNCRPLVLNNIVVHNDHYGVYAQFSSIPTLAYNNVWGHTAVIGGEVANTDYVPASLERNNSISLDPLFVGAGDWHLSATSPCRNAGDPRPEYDDPDGSRNDMGAYGGPGAQFGVGAVQTPPAGARLVLK